MTGVILARKGSKRLPGKNTKLLQGKPLIKYTIDEAIKSKSIDRIVVSTDDNDIIRYCFDNYGFTSYCVTGLETRIIIERPPYLATHNAKSEECLLHVMDLIDEDDYVCLLQPTSPLRTAKDIDGAYEMMIKYKWPGIAGYNERTNKQNGFFWITNWKSLYTFRELERDHPYYIEHERSIDIDNDDDFKKAEKILGSIN